MADRAAEEGEREAAEGKCLSEAQRQVSDRCSHALRHAKNDSQTLAASSSITRSCPASQSDRPTMRRIFEAVGSNLPARSSVTAVRDGAGSGSPPQESSSSGAASSAALSTDPDMAAHPRSLATVPLSSGSSADGSAPGSQKRAGSGPEEEEVRRSAGGEGREVGGAPESCRSDEAVAADCFQVSTAVCARPGGPEQISNRGGVPASCRAAEQSRYQQRALSSSGCLLCSRAKEKAWRKHPAELLSSSLRLCTDFCRPSDPTRFPSCSQSVRFLPPPEVASQSAASKEAVGGVWAASRPTSQAKSTPKQIGPVSVLSACLLDLYGWESVGPPKFCCSSVNRACVEVRMGSEEPPGNDSSPESQNTSTGCYRIMEAAMEQACAAGDAAPPTDSAHNALSSQQSRQVLCVSQEAFSAVVYHSQQVDPGRYADPFVFASFRALCSWSAEETSCSKEEVAASSPFLVAYARRHSQEATSERELSDWMARVSVGEDGEAWTGGAALRYLLPASCHSTAEDAPRKASSGSDAPASSVDFSIRTWSCWRGGSGGALPRDPSMETACSALSNVAVTEPESVRNDPCFRTSEAHSSEALPVSVNKPRLSVSAANYCASGSMIGRSKAPPTGSTDAAQRRFFSAASRFLRDASRSGSGPVPAGGGGWEEAGESWRSSSQASGACVRAQPWIVGSIRDEGWSRDAVGVSTASGAAPGRHAQTASEEASCAVAERCPDCRREIGSAMRSSEGGASSTMKSSRKSVGV